MLYGTADKHYRTCSEDVDRSGLPVEADWWVERRQRSVERKTAGKILLCFSHDAIFVGRRPEDRQS